ncbi:hypothetical protein BDV59DRAFT_181375 [Aspergillus ambiguus]|uniref:uncharacterized protein n=1 Tax=Aspergillus ambiguus TaxID=176160 RepID=UPI003CCD4C2B
MADMLYEPYTKQRPRPKPKAKSTSKSKPDHSKRCWDWVIVHGNCHYAKNRSMFRSYRRAPGKIAGRRVLGVGTVELRVRRGPQDDRTNTLVLQEVLHMPNAPCNALCIDKYRDANPDSDVEESESEDYVAAVKDVDREPLWYGHDYGHMLKVVLAGQPEGESHLGDGKSGGAMLGVVASPEELETLWRRVRERDWAF